ncbi:unnamed protein product [Adineta ricciae]|uniref:Uncharacterized protein n=1 Tax=Adineta ricciae TaxID=249248 RepID=A0A813R6S1_ADIRI|nr:unnamed protein product [Adineta ricciae]CAF0896524.1 unnamed protein product [Adineta ricciae]
MAEINSLSKVLRTSSISSDQDAASIPSTSRSASRSASPNSNWIIQYKPAFPNTRKGIWGGYETQEEFMTMHLR